MAFQLSPGVNVSEIDLTTVVPAVSTTAGAIVGRFEWGPVNTRVLVDSEITLVDRFGKPTTNTFTSFFPAANFLAYGNNLRVVRAANNMSNNATSGSTGFQIKNEDVYSQTYPVGTNSALGSFVARYPGDMGNSLQVAVCANTSQFNSSLWTTCNVGATGVSLNLASYFAAAPNTSTYATSQNGSYDEMHIAVIDVNGKFTSSGRATVLETYSNVSKASDAKNDDGSSNYYVQKILDNSKYIYIANHIGTTFGSVASNTTFGSATDANCFVQLAGGTTQTPTLADYQLGCDQFADARSVDVSLLIAGDIGEKGVAGQNYVANIADSRKDAVAFISPTLATAVTSPTSAGITAYRNSLSINSSYAVMDSAWKYQFDKYNNVYRWVPANGDIAGLCVYTDNVRDPWFSPAGLNRGQIKNVVKLSFNPTKADRDVLYAAGVNPLVAFPGEGTVLFGDKTMLSKPSAFDRINVRRLFIVLEKAIATASKYSLFEFNDEFTRSQFVALVEPFLRDIQGRRGIYDYRVVCDTTNNTQQVIDSNQFVGDIYIKPARSINFIQLNFVAVRTGVDFTEIVGKF